MDRHKRFKKEKTSSKSALGRCLVVGAGPVGITTAYILGKSGVKGVDVYTVDTLPDRQAYKELVGSGGYVASTGLIKGRRKINSFCLGEESLRNVGVPDTILLCLPNQYYVSSIAALVKHNLIIEGQTIVLVSPKIGSGLEARQELERLGFDAEKSNLVSFSMYYAATKPVEGHRTKVYTRAIKKKIYVGTNKPRHPSTRALRAALKSVGTASVVFSDPFNAEMYNVNPFIHAQFTLTKEILKDMFGQNGQREYMYRPDPEGCLSEETVRQAVETEEEINRVLSALGLTNVNLLKLLQADVYPIPGFASEKDFARYPGWSQKRREEKIEQWFLGRQRDPLTGEPHLDAVKLPRTRAENGAYVVPRIPAEDYSAVVLFINLGKKLGIKTPRFVKMRRVFNSFTKGLDKPVDVDVTKVESDMKSLAESIVSLR